MIIKILGYSHQNLTKKLSLTELSIISAWLRGIASFMGRNGLNLVAQLTFD